MNSEETYIKGTGRVKEKYSQRLIRSSQMKIPSKDDIIHSSNCIMNTATIYQQ